MKKMTKIATQPFTFSQSVIIENQQIANAKQE